MVASGPFWPVLVVILVCFGGHFGRNQTVSAVLAPVFAEIGPNRSEWAGFGLNRLESKRTGLNQRKKKNGKSAFRTLDIALGQVWCRCGGHRAAPVLSTD